MALKPLNRLEAAGDRAAQQAAAIADRRSTGWRGQRCPGDPRGLIGQRHDHQHRQPAGQHAAEQCRSAGPAGSSRRRTSGSTIPPRRRGSSDRPRPPPRRCGGACLCPPDRRQAACRASTGWSVNQREACPAPGGTGRGRHRLASGVDHVGSPGSSVDNHKPAPASQQVASGAASNRNERTACHPPPSITAARRC